MGMKVAPLGAAALREPGLGPAMEPGMEPGLGPGMGPGMESGMEPGMESGMEPDLEAGMEPGMGLPELGRHSQDPWQIESLASGWICSMLTVTGSVFLLTLWSSPGVHRQSEWPGFGGVGMPGCLNRG